ncbi:hypothetical protein C8J57DRAFT_1600262 [Mycena rebaudengoi]|nr:hypothetical protein C8J57DRAFT_1600262 [Mycena rebaudengoi]
MNLVLKDQAFMVCGCVLDSEGMIGLACGRWAHLGLGLREVFFGKGNFVRFVIVSVIFLLQQWSGQNSVNYYLPQIFASISYNDWRSPLLATGIYGVVNLITISLFFDLGVEWFGRKTSFFISAMGMISLFFIVGAILKTHPPPETSSDSIVKIVTRVAGHAGMLYIYVCFYSIGGPLPCLIVLFGAVIHGLPLVNMDTPSLVRLTSSLLVLESSSSTSASIFAARQLRVCVLCKLQVILSGSLAQHLARHSRVISTLA